MMKKTGAAIFWGILIVAFLFSPSVSAAEEIAVSAAKYGVQYKTHVQDYGWEKSWKSDGELSGTVGEGKRLEALRVKLTGTNLPANANIQTFVHVQNIGDRGPFEMDQAAGSEGKGLRLERITLYLNNLPDYQLRYNVQVQNKGWLKDENDVSTWFISGQSAGTTGEGLRLEGIKIVVVEVNEAYDAYTKALAAVNEDDYTTQSWNEYQSVVEDNAVTTEDSSRDINRATAAIIAAQKFLELASDMSAYKKALADAVEADYTPDSWELYQEVVNSNFVTKEDSQADINTATKNIIEAQKLLQRKINLTRYYELVDGALESDYTPESWLVYQQVLADNVVTAANTQTQIDAAVKKIEEAQRKMVRRLDFNGYNSLLKAVKEADYTEKSWAAYQKVLDANVMTENNTQSEIAKAMTKIEEAQLKLVKASDLSAYEEALAAVSKENYTSASWAAYDKVVKAIKVTDADTQSVIDAATKKIVAAQLKLVGLGDLSAYHEALAAVEKDNYTPTSWAAYDKVVKASKVTAADGQAAIDAATKKIVAAQLKLVGLGDLSAYNEALAAVEKDNYTPTSWAAYDKVVKASKVTAADGQTAIDAATKKIVAAQLKLVEKGNLSGYQEVLAAVDQDSYTPLSWAAYQKVVAANVVTAISPQDAIEKAIEKILAAQFNLVRKGDLTNYQNALESVKQTNYTTATWSEYQKVVKANVMTANNTQTDIDVATANIIAAQEYLEFKGGDLRAYEATLAKAKQADYTTVTWKEYQKAVTANVVTAENKQTEIDQATKNIQAAQAALVKKGDLSSYNIALAGLDEADYTAASWKAYQLVAKANVRTVEDTQAAIDLSTTKILEAQKSLVKVGDLTAYNAVLAAVRKENYTTATWNAYQNVVKANVRTKTDTQLLIDDAVKKILAAQKSLVRKYDTSAYNALLAAVKQADYIPASWTTYQAVVKAYPASYSPIQTAIEKIEAAQAKLVKVVDRTAYDNALLAVKEAEYTVDSWEKYEDELKKPIYQITATSTQTQFDEATKKIIEAQKTILKKKVNLTIYLKLLEDAVEYDYSPASWAAYQKILTKNVVTENNTQTEVDAAVKAITVAQNNVLVRRLDYTKYDELLKVAPINPVDPKIKDLYTDVSWGIYEKVVKENTLTWDKEIDTQTGIDKAVVNIAAAQKKLVKAGDLTAYNLVLKAVERKDYTTASWDIYQKVLEANEVSKNHSQADIDAATEKIRLAQLKLAKGGDLTAYKALTEDLDQDLYTSVSWAVYQKVIDANFVSSTDGQAKINAAVAKLTEAARKLVKRANRDEYDLVLIYNFYLDEDMEPTDYTTTSWEAYQKVLDANYMDLDKSQAQVDAAVANIKKAQFKLLKAGNLVDYYELLKTNMNLDRAMVSGEYTSASWATYQSILDKNQMDRDKSQKQIDAAVVAIERAQKNLKLKGDMDEYNATLAKVKAEDWTVASWTAYMKVVMAKENYMTGDNDEATIKRAIGNITLAQTTVLKKKGNVDDYNKLITKYVGQSDRFKTTAWNAYMAVLTKNVMTTENTQDQIASAMTFISIAQEELLKNPAASLLEFNRVKGLVDDESAYTPDSWETYAGMVRKYQNITKDSIQTDVDKATAALVVAQKSLVRQNGTELKAYLKMLELYQKNYRDPDTSKFFEIKDKIGNWGEYENVVLRYANFFEDYTVDWEASNITKESSPTEIIAATNAIETAIRSLRPVDFDPNSTDPLSVSGAINSYLAKKNEAVALGWNNPLEASTYTESSYKAFADACKVYDLMNLIINSSGNLIGITQIDAAKAGLQFAIDNKNPVLRATDGDIQKFQAEKNWYAEFKASYYTTALWKNYETKITQTNYDLDHPEEIVQTKISDDTDLIIEKREKLIYNATYVLEQAGLTAANMGTFDISDGSNNVIVRAKELMIARLLEDFKIANYEVTFQKIDGDGKGTATFDSGGTIISPGDGNATIKIGIRALGDPLSTELITTGEIKIDVRD